MYLEKRKSGISLVGELPWGSHFCMFYRTMGDLLDILLPYFNAGLEGNELCVWVSSEGPGAEDAKNALKKAAPPMRKYVDKGQMEIIPNSRWRSMDGLSGSAVVSMLDKAISDGFDGLRLAFDVSPEKDNGRTFPMHEVDAIGGSNVLVVFAYPRGEVDALGLMEVVKNHRFALVRNADRWEVIESSEARMVRDELKRSDEKLKFLFSSMSEGFAYHRIVLNEEGTPCDYVFLEVNDAFERLTGLDAKNIIGRRVTEAIPGIEKDPSGWIGKYGEVALTGKPAQFESFSTQLNRWYSVSAFSPHKGYFAVTFSDITVRRQAEEEITKLNEDLKSKIADLSAANALMRDSQRAALNMMEDAVTARRQTDEAYRTLQREVAERKRAEEARRESEEKFRRIVETANEGIWVVDADRRTSFVNNKMAQMLGYSVEEMIGKSGSEFLDREGQALSDSTMENRKKGISESYEFKLIRKDKTSLWTLVNAVPLFDKDGAFAGSLSMFTDITKRKNAEEVIRRRNTVLAGINTMFTEALSSETDETLARACLRVAEEVTGSKFGFIGEIGPDGLLHDTAISDPGWELCTMYDKAGHRRPPGDFKLHGIYGRVLQEGKSFFTNNPASHPDSIGTPEGHPPLTAFLGVPFVQNGTVIGMIAVGNRDGGYRAEDLESLEALAPAIVEALYRVRAEQALRASEERYRSLFENMLHGFAHCKMLYDEGGRPSDFIYLDVNSAFGTLTGLEDVVGKRVTDVIPGVREANPELFDIYGRVALTGQPERFEMDFKPLDLWLSISVYSTVREHFVAIFDDITERKKAEADVLKLSEDMAARNLELETVNKELESFVYSVSHDLRAPNRSVSGFAKILMEDYADKLDAQGMDFLSRIYNGSEKMSHRIEALLHLSRISRQDLVRSEVDLSSVASAIVSDLRLASPGRSAEAVIAEGLTASVDLNLIRVALANLFENAWKFTSKTPDARIEFGILDCEARGTECGMKSEIANPESEIVYFVRDNGAGFDPAYADRMFWPFHRLHSDAEFEGTGIGLAIVERVIRRHGGRIWAKGEPGKGAAFYFTLG